MEAVKHPIPATGRTDVSGKETAKLFFSTQHHLKQLPKEDAKRQREANPYRDAAFRIVELYGEDSSENDQCEVDD